MARDDPQFKLRLPADLKAKVDAAADTVGRSINQEIVARLEASFDRTDNADLMPVVSRLSRDLAWAEYKLFGKKLTAENLAFAVGILLSMIPREHPLIRENRSMIEGWMAGGLEVLEDRVTASHFDAVVAALKKARADYPLSGEPPDDAFIERLERQRKALRYDTDGIPLGLTMSLDGTGPAVEYKSKKPSESDLPTLKPRRREPRTAVKGGKR